MQVGEKIFLLRRERNWSQSDLAAALEEPVGTVTAWETGLSIPELDRMIHLSQVFEVPLQQLAGDQFQMLWEAEKRSAEAQEKHLQKEQRLAYLRMLLVAVIILLGVAVNVCWYRVLFRVIGIL